MLRFLSIRRLAVIDAVQVEFGPGLNVLTGETGAGKSILVEAVGLLLGGRASGDLVRTGEEMATVEAIFESGEEEFLVRREVTAQGRSRAFVNGELATAAALRDLSARLVELHGQHEHHTLLDPSTHLAVIDTFGRHGALLAPVQSAFAAMQMVRDERARIEQAAASRQARQELVEFQLAELDRVAPTVAEDEQLATTKHVLASAERIERLCGESYSALYDSDDAILARLGAVWRRVGDLAGIDPQFQPYLESRESIKAQLEDLAGFLRRYADHIEASPGRLQQVEDRLALLERLKKKHGPTLADVLATRDRLRVELEELTHSDERLEDLRRQHDAARAEYLAAAERLAGARRDAARELGRRLERSLGDLAMERTTVEVRFHDGAVPETEWTASGIDAAEFFVSPNPGEEPRALARIVSGGELSRIMLAIKALTASSRLGYSEAADRAPSAAAPGLIFDEVDAGIGGRAADVVGGTLRTLGSTFQVLCITHLPQIAAYADAQYAIRKHVDGGRTRTDVTRLDEAGRVEELARMLGGAAVTPGLKASAREMLDSRRHGDQAAAKGEVKPKGESERMKSPRPASKTRVTRR
jgi:DNA repair protein RecN (Recombination protein N)